MSSNDNNQPKYLNKLFFTRARAVYSKVASQEVVTTKDIQKLFELDKATISKLLTTLAAHGIITRAQGKPTSHNGGKTQDVIHNAVSWDVLLEMETSAANAKLTFTEEQRLLRKNGSQMIDTRVLNKVSNSVFDLARLIRC